jgi:hypothetical protein
MNNVYIVQGLGFGDDEDCFYNLQAFATEAAALAHIAVLQAEDAANDSGLLEYTVEEVLFTL